MSEMTWRFAARAARPGRCWGASISARGWLLSVEPAASAGSSPWAGRSAALWLGAGAAALWLGVGAAALWLGAGAAALRLGAGMGAAALAAGAAALGVGAAALAAGAAAPGVGAAVLGAVAASAGLSVGDRCNAAGARVRGVGGARAGEAAGAQEGLEVGAGEVAEIAHGGVVGGVEESAVAVDVEHQHAALLGEDRLEQAGDPERSADGGGECGFGQQLEADQAEDGAVEQAALGDRDHERVRQRQRARHREHAQTLAPDPEERDARGDLGGGLDQGRGDPITLTGLHQRRASRGQPLREIVGAAGLVRRRGRARAGCRGGGLRDR
jgi:hypothetical protein